VLYQTKPVDEFAVEDLGNEQFFDVVVDEIILDGAVESLAVGVHLWRPWIRMVMGEVEAFELF